MSIAYAYDIYFPKTVTIQTTNILYRILNKFTLKIYEYIIKDY